MREDRGLPPPDGPAPRGQGGHRYIHFRYNHSCYTHGVNSRRGDRLT